MIVHRSRDSRKVQCYVGLTRMHSSRMRTARSSTVMGGLRDREPPWRETPHPLDRDPPLWTGKALFVVSLVVICTVYFWLFGQAFASEF